MKLTNHKRTSLAVKYRPKTFSDLTEQSVIVDILTNQIRTGTVKSAYLFTGPSGTGKTTSARIFADMINEGKGNPIEVDAASNSGVDNIRRIIEDSKKKALDAEYKIFIVDECHSLSSGAWQAMLKLLEEPPKFSIFILCTTDAQKIPATIMSRVQRYQFNKISDEGVVKRLEAILDEENISTYDIEAIQFIAKTANGGMRDAITTMDKCLSLSSQLSIDNVLKAIGSENYSTFFELLTQIISKDTNCILIIDKVFEDGKDLKQFIKQFERFILDCSKFLLFNDIKYTSLPDTVEIRENLASIKGLSSDIIDMIHNLSNIIKYEADPKTVIEITLLLHCKED